MALRPTALTPCGSGAFEIGGEETNCRSFSCASRSSTWRAITSSIVEACKWKREAGAGGGDPGTQVEQLRSRMAKLGIQWRN
jgi:hypothetical protein